MRSLCVALGAALFVASTGSALAGPAVTTVKTTMRAAPDFHAAVVQTIPPNAEIDVTGCGQMWCSASWRNIAGFVRANTFAADPVAPPPPYAGGPVVVAPPVVIAPYWGWRGGWGWGGGWGYGYHHYY